jgi:hypothetical protein
MKHTFLNNEEILMMLSDYYDNKKTIKECMLKYKVGKSTVIKYLHQKGSGGRKRKDYGNNKYECNEYFFENIDNHEKAYWFGFIAADGNIYNNKLQICLDSKDEDHLVNFCKRIGYNGIIYTDRTCKRLMICRKKIVDDLKLLGIKENKTHLIDDNIFNKIPQEYIRSAILGYIDGDGSFSVKKTGVTFSIVGNLSFLYFLKDFFIKNEIELPDPKKDKRTKSTFYCSRFLKKDLIELLVKCLYDNGSQDFLARKRDKLNYEK